MSTNLSNFVAESIKQKIISGEYSENDKLPNEQELANLFNVSRTTIREAIKRLVSQNIVTIKRGVGTYVNANPGLMDDPLGFEFIPEEVITKDLREFRYYIEPAAAKFAAKRATKQQISDMADIIEGMKLFTQKNDSVPESSDVLSQFGNFELLFHSLLYEMTGNSVFKHLQPIIIKSVQLYYYKQILSGQYSIIDAYKCHKKIFNAIRARDEQDAYEQMLKHMLV